MWLAHLPNDGLRVGIRLLHVPPRTFDCLRSEVDLSECLARLQTLLQRLLERLRRGDPLSILLLLGLLDLTLFDREGLGDGILLRELLFVPEPVERLRVITPLHHAASVLPVGGMGAGLLRHSSSESTF